MFRCFVILCAFSLFLIEGSLFGPKYPPTEGEVWPRPKYQRKSNEYYTINPYDCKVSVLGQTCDILTRALERYGFIVRDTNRIVSRIKKRNNVGTARSTHSHKYKGKLQSLDIYLTAPCEEYPNYGMDEKYNLTVSSNVKLTSNSIWGILRGLETWTHLFYLSKDGMEIRINKTEIMDEPRYLHRGLLIDTSRHFVSLANIQKTLDAMAMNKMNVLHWHIVDDQSFPYQSEKFPDLSRYGAYHSSLVYTQNDIRTIIDYARDRGIRVIPEFDVPGHTRSWGEAYPNILSKCYNDDKFVDYGPMNPTLNVTYKLLQDLFTEVQGLFPDKYFHVGGDEVDLECWDSDPQLREYMKEHNITSVDKLHALFMSNVLPLLGEKSTPVVWQEVFDEGVPLNPNTIVQIWKGDQMTEILSAGYKLLYSTAWYLDHLKTGGDWQEMYLSDPRQIAKSQRAENVDNVIGGEACMWGEVVNDYNIISRVWPRASAVAEVLWSPETAMYYGIEYSVYKRLEEHTCRMNRRGIPAQPPSGPGYCIGAA